MLWYAEFVPAKWKQLLDFHEKYATEFRERARTETSPKLREFFLKWAERHEADLARMRDITPAIYFTARSNQKRLEELK